jgi:hypothetical protein
VQWVPRVRVIAMQPEKSVAMTTSHQVQIDNQPRVL